MPRESLRARLRRKVRLSLGHQWAVFGPPERLTVGQDVQLSNVFINTVSGRVTIGDGAFMGHDVLLVTGTHRFDVTMQERRQAVAEGRDITIGKGVWIASRAVIVGPCTIGDHAVIGGGCVIDRDIPAGTIVRQRQELELEPIRFAGDAGRPGAASGE